MPRATVQLYGENAAEGANFSSRQQFPRPNGIKGSLAGERIDPGRRVTDKRPVLSDDISLGKRPLLGRRQYMAVKLCALRRYVMFLNKILQVSSQLRARMRGHAPANAYREMIAARERPDVAFKLRQEFDGDGISRLRHEVALRHLQLVPLQCACFGE